MKNNILLIAAVTVVSLVVIVLAVVFSTSDGKDDESSNSNKPAVSDTVSTAPTEKPQSTSSEPTTEPEPVVTTTSATTTEPPESSQPEEKQPEVMTSDAQTIIATARSLIGIEFMDGGDTPDGFDNSGFIYHVLRENGYITCPRNVTAQSEWGSAGGYNNLQPGDLVFFQEDGFTGATFGGIYIGDGKMIACLMPGTSVMEIDITSNYYQNTFYCCVKYL